MIIKTKKHMFFFFLKPSYGIVPLKNLHQGSLLKSGGFPHSSPLPRPGDFHYKLGPKKKAVIDGVTPLKTNMSPKNRWLEDVFPTEMVTF